VSGRPDACFQALMAIADRYARRLVTDAVAPAAVLLIERAGEAIWTSSARCSCSRTSWTGGWRC
jgi:hypothetical protein